MNVNDYAYPVLVDVLGFEPKINQYVVEFKDIDIAGYYDGIRTIDGVTGGHIVLDIDLLDNLRDYPNDLEGGLVYETIHGFLQPLKFRETWDKRTILAIDESFDIIFEVEAADRLGLNEFKKNLYDWFYPSSSGQIFFAALWDIREDFGWAPFLKFFKLLDESATPLVTEEDNEALCEYLSEVAGEDLSEYFIKHGLIEVADNAEIISFTPPSGTFQRGETASTSVVISNTGTTTRSFWVGLSWWDSDGTRYDVTPKATSSLSPNGEGDVSFSFTIPSGASAGWCDISTAIWDDYSGGNVIEPQYDGEDRTNAFQIENIPVISAEITEITLSDKNIKISDIIPFQLTIKNTGNIKTTYYVYLTILGPTEKDSSTYMPDTILDQIIINEDEIKQHKFTWQVPDDAPPGAYSVIFHVYDKDLNDPNAKYLDGKGKPFCFMIDRDVSYVQIEGSKDNRVISVHIDNVDVEKYSLLTEQKTRLEKRSHIDLLDLYHFLNFSSIPGVPFEYELALGNIDIQISDDGSYDFTILQMFNGIGKVYNAPIIDLYDEALADFSETVISSIFSIIRPGSGSVIPIWKNFVEGEWDELIEEIIVTVIDVKTGGIVGFVKQLQTLVRIKSSYLDFPYFWLSTFEVPNPVQIERIYPNQGEYEQGSDISFCVRVTQPGINALLSGAKVEAWYMGYGIEKITLIEDDENLGEYLASNVDPFHLSRFYEFIIQAYSSSSMESTPYFGFVHDGYWAVPWYQVDDLKNANENEVIGATVNFDFNINEVSTVASTTIFNEELEVDTTIKDDRVVIQVNSEMFEGQTIVINLDYESLQLSELNELLVLYDGQEISLASDFSDILNPNDEDVAEYLVLMGTEGYQVLVSIPKFSIHTIEIIKYSTIDISTNLPRFYSTSIYLDDVFSGELRSDEPLMLRYVNGSSHKMTIDEIILRDEGTRFVCTENVVNFSSTKKLEFEYIEQVYLTVSSQYGSPKGEGWYNIGTSVIYGVDETISLSGLVGTLGAKYQFSHWEGDSSSNLPLSTILMDKPKQVDAVWRTDYIILYYNAGIALFGVIILLLTARRLIK